MIGLIDFGGGNLASVANAMDHLGVEFRLVIDPSSLDPVDAVIFPGVGAAGPAMATLRRSGLDRALPDFIGSGRPYLGICLGLQLLFERSSEDGTDCLGVLGGSVVRLPTREKLPHVGWNTVQWSPAGPMLGGDDQSHFYFTHSYSVQPRDRGLVWGTTDYGGAWVSAVARPPLFGVQFHPERSGETGLRLLRGFCLIAEATPRPDAG